MKRLPALLVCVTALSVLMGGFASGEKAATSLAAPGSNHLVIIAFENKSYAQVVGSTAAPYINNTLIPNGRLFTNYYSTTHPSLPDYLILTSGDNRGCINDACPADGIAGENILHELNLLGPGMWKVYAENMPSACYRLNKYPYVVRHNPATYYSNLDSTVGDGTCATQDVPYSQLAIDMAAKTLPPFAMIIPNIYNDMHDAKNVAPCLLGDVTQNKVCQGDTWLSQKLPAILSNGGLNDVTVVLWFDEGTGYAGGAGQVLLLEVGAGITPGTTVTSPFNHYGLANAIADWFGVPHMDPAVPSLN